MANKIQLRRDIKSNWEAGTKTLVDGEMGIEFPNDFDAMDPHAGEYPPRFKIGPGNWNELPYSSLGIDWDGNLEVPNNLTIGGNFTVTGDTTYVNATNTVLTDNILELHAPDGGVGDVWTVNDTKDIGLRMHYYNGADKNAALIMDNGTWRLKWIVDGTEVGGQFNHTGLGDIEASTFYGALSGNATTATTASIATTVTLVATNSTNSSHYLTFVDSATGNDNVRTDTSLTYNPSSNTLTAVTFSGALSGNATSATNLAGGSSNRIPYQTGSGTTSFITAPSTSDRYLRWTGSAFEWASVTTPTSLSLSTLAVSGTASLNGLTQIQQADYPFTSKTNATGTVTHDCSVGQVFYHTTPSANFTANFTNLGLTTGYITKVELYIVQGSSARLPTAVQVAGSSKTINWYGAVSPTGHSNSVDLVTFTFLLSGTTYVVFGKVEQYDSVSSGGGGYGGGGYGGG